VQQQTLRPSDIPVGRPRKERDRIGGREGKMNAWKLGKCENGGEMEGEARIREK